MKTRIIAAVVACVALSSFADGTYSLNADWRFSWTKAPLPLKNAVSSMRHGGTDVFSPGYGGKASGPSGLKSPKDIKMKGSFKVYNASHEPIDADVVPDLTFAHHYGF